MNEKNFRRTLVLGDIHGAKEALLQVLSLSKFDNELDRLIFLGDVADGWHEVPECVDILLNIKNLICIRGNHDIWLRDWLKSDYDNLMWRSPVQIEVHQYNKTTGNYIQSFKSATEAGRLLNIDRKSITNNCVGKSKSSGGFIWSKIKKENIYE